MSNLQKDVDHLVGSFVAQVSELARRAAIETLQAALGKPNSGSRAVPGIGRGGKRRSDQLDELGDMFTEFVAKHPGLRIEQINKELGTNTKDLALPIRKLVADGALKTKGEKRATTYFAGARAKKS